MLRTIIAGVSLVALSTATAHAAETPPGRYEITVPLQVSDSKTNFYVGCRLSSSAVTQDQATLARNYAAGFGTGTSALPKGIVSVKPTDTSIQFALSAPVGSPKPQSVVCGLVNQQDLSGELEAVQVSRFGSLTQYSSSAVK